MNLQITSAMPMPLHTHKPEKHIEFRLSIQRLEVGESTFYDRMTHTTAQSYCSHQGAYMGKRFTTRAEGNGFRCWRVA